MLSTDRSLLCLARVLLDRGIGGLTVTPTALNSSSMTERRNHAPLWEGRKATSQPHPDRCDQAGMLGELDEFLRSQLTDPDEA